MRKRYFGHAPPLAGLQILLLQNGAQERERISAPIGNTLFHCSGITLQSVLTPGRMLSLKLASAGVTCGSV